MNGGRVKQLRRDTADGGGTVRRPHPGRKHGGDPYQKRINGVIRVVIGKGRVTSFWGHP